MASAVRPSASFSKGIRLSAASVSRWSGSGICTIIPWIAGSAATSSIFASSSACVVSAGISTCSERMPASSHALCLLAT